LLQQPGDLWQRTIAQTQHAIACGALRSLPTTYEIVEEQGMQFLVRIFLDLVRKQAAQVQQVQEKRNPFLPYEPDLYVMDVSETHVCILNKFNVVDHHLLIITRAFEAQESVLTLPDFQALWACLQEVDGLGFYNAGAPSGASQPHKHLQVVPLPLCHESGVLPLPSQLVQGNLASLPFVYGLVQFDLANQSIDQAAESLLTAYQSLLQQVGCARQEQNPAPYNLLVTRQWMFLVPRSHDSYQGIGFNALGFAGALLVRDAEQMQQLKQIGLMQLLQKVAIAR
jgi:ATP adenylyltransferase